MSRPFLEHLVRQRTLARPNITLRAGCAATDLVADGQGRVIGVRVEPGDGMGVASPLLSDLTVDCMVMNLLAPPASLMAPGMLLRVIRATWRRRGRRQIAPRPSMG